MRQNKKYQQWSARWEKARSTIGAIDEVICLLQNMPQGWQRQVWAEGFGYRHKHKEGSGPRGEQKVEHQLFNKYLFGLEHAKKVYPFVALYHKIPLANQSKEQRIADALGLLVHQRKTHPVLVEVKTDANNCWYALVENLQQVIMARANPRYFGQFLSFHKLPDKPAFWGMVLAPRQYYSKDSNSGENWKQCLRLLDRLKKDTEARIAFAYSDYLNSHKIKIHHSNWSQG
jgi:hypothetical protein